MEANSTLLVFGLVLSTLGSIFLSWTVLWPQVFLTKQKRDGEIMKERERASEYAKTLYPNEEKIQDVYADMMARIYYRDSRQETAQCIGYIAVTLFLIGMVVQIIAIL